MGRILFNVPPDGNCAFRTLTVFTGIPHTLLRWFAAVRVAIQLTANRQQRFMDLVRTMATPGAAPLGNTPPEIVRAVATPHTLVPMVVVGLTCQGLALPVIALDCAPDAQPSSWPLPDLSVTYYKRFVGNDLHPWDPELVNESVRIIVHQSDYFCPALLREKVQADRLLPCRTFERAMAVLTGKVLAAECDEFDPPLDLLPDVTVRLHVVSCVDLL